MRSSWFLLAALTANASTAQSGPTQFRMMYDRSVPDHFGTAVPLGLAFADIDGDGDRDLHVATGSQFTVGGQDRLYRNDGRGVFTDITAGNLPSDDRRTEAALFVDVDGDGDVDLVHGNTPFTGASGQNRLFLNDGSGAFTDVTATHLPADQDYTSSLAAGDVDADGDVDLVIGNSPLTIQSVGNRLYLNDGTGVFTDATTGRLPTTPQFPRRMALADLDGDGDLDLTVCNLGGSSDVRLYANDGSGTFSDQTATRLVPALLEFADLALADCDGDGDVDLVAVTPGVQRNRFYRNNGNGVFLDATLPTFNARGDELLELGDIDGDGDIDVVVSNWLGGETQLMLNDGTGGFTPAPAGSLPTLHGLIGGFGGLALADVDSDTDLDLMLQGAASGRLSWNGSAEQLLLNDGSGVFHQPDASELPARAVVVALGDIDGDRDDDVLVAGVGTVLYRNDGKRRFTDVTQLHLPPQTHVTEAHFFDADDDGDSDLFLARGRDGNEQSQLWLGDGTGHFTDATATHLPVLLAQTWHIAIGDVDADGDSDIVQSNRQHPNRLLRNDGPGRFTSVAGFAIAPTGGESVALADFDGDGDLDLLDHVTLRENDGTGVFTLRTTLTGLASGTISVTRAGDLDADGLPDILVCHWIAQPQIAWNRHGTSPWAFTMASLPYAGRTADADLFDMDVDGDTDLALVGGNYACLFENLGGGAFADASDRWYLRRQSDALAIGDLDRDGDPDMVEAVLGEPCHVYYNLHRHHAVPDPADAGGRYRCELSYHPGYLAQPVLAALFFSTAEVDVPLPGIGVLGIDPNAAITVGTFVMPAPQGVHDFDLFVPPLPSLQGVAFWSQAVFVDGTLPGSPLRLSGALVDVVR